MSSVVDARSDTVTKPSGRMREAMLSCEVGDDVLGDDYTVQALETRIARMLGMEKALFFPTGTMANLAAIMTWCDARNSEIIVGDKSHIFYYECGGAAHVANVSPLPLPNEFDGTIKLENILGAIRDKNIHFPVTRLVALENTQNYCGGRLLPDGYLQSVSVALKERNIKLHLDGARIWNAAAAAGKSVAEVVAGADSVSVCMSKCLGAPAGSLLAGPAEFIELARYARKTLGGGMRQVGILAAPCLVALDDFDAGIVCQQDHLHARRIAEALASEGVLAFNIDLQTVDSNIVVVHLARAVTRAAADVCALIKEHDVLVAPRDARTIRVVTHRDLCSEDIDKLISAFQTVSSCIVES